MRLAIDIGNTRIKWGVFGEDSGLQEFGAAMNADCIAEPSAWQGCELAIMSNVAGAEMGLRVSALLASLHIPLHEIKATTYACGVHNQYAQAEKLGADRWASIIAAWQLVQQPCVVVNVGTAMTVDAVSVNSQGEGVFLGGMILPGLNLMQASLIQSTAGIREQNGQWQDFPTSTANAIFTAALTAAAGNIKDMAARLQYRAAKMPKVILTGGDAHIVADCLLNTIVIENELLIADNLVLQGLLLLGKTF